MHWIREALCKSDEHSERWISYKYSDVQYAKSICMSCKVKDDCAAAIETSGMYGVLAGLSEFDRLNLQWKEAKNINEFNWG